MTDSPPLDNAQFDKLKPLTDEQFKPIGQQLNKWALKLRQYGLPPEALVSNHSIREKKIEGMGIDGKEERVIPSADKVVESLKATGLYSDVYIAPPGYAMTWPDGKLIKEETGLVAIVQIPKKQTPSV